MTQQKSILVLEDNDFVRMQIVKFLQSGGYAAIEASNVDDGLKIMQNDSIACALVDVRMEPDDGFAFIEKMQVHDIKAPVVLVTGDQNHDILSKASQLGVSSVLMKPVDKDRLLKMVDRLTGGRAK